MATYEAKRYDFSGANITALNGSNVASGTVAAARIADLATSKITSGTFADARISSGSVTQHVSATTQAQSTWTPSPNSGGFNNIQALYSRTGNIVTCTAAGTWNSNPAVSTNAFTISGLPITSYNGSGSSGSGYYSFHRQQGERGILHVKPNSTTIEMFTDGANLSGTAAYNTSQLFSAMNDNTDAGGVKISQRNVEDSSSTGSNLYWYIFVVYMV